MVYGERVRRKGEAGRHAGGQGACLRRTKGHLVEALAVQNEDAGGEAANGGVPAR